MYEKRQTQKRSELLIVPLTLFICLCCWIPAYYMDVGSGQEGLPTTSLWSRIADFFPSRLSVFVVGALLLCVIAGLIQNANYFLIIFPEKTKWPFCLFLLLNSANYGFIPLHAASVASLFLIYCMLELFKAYQEGMTPGSAYKALFFLGVGSLFWVHVLWLIPLFWYGMYQFRLLNLRSFIASLLGISTLYWLILGACLWRQDYSIITTAVRSLTAFDTDLPVELFRMERLAIPLAVSLLTALFTLYLRFHKFEVGLRTRQFVLFLSTAAKYLIPFLVLFEDEQSGFLGIFNIPLSLLFTYFCVRIGGKHAVLFYGLPIIFFLILWGIQGYHFLSF